MEQLAGQNGLILAIGIIIGIYILVKVAGKVLKSIGIVILIGLGYFFWQGGTIGELKSGGLKLFFKNAKITDLQDTFCQGEKEDKFKCECIVQPIYQDITTRLSEAQVAQLDTDDEARLEEIRISLKNKRKEITSCGMEKNKPMMEKLAWIFKEAGNTVVKGLNSTNGN